MVYLTLSLLTNKTIVIQTYLKVLFYPDRRTISLSDQRYSLRPCFGLTHCVMGDR